MEILRLILGPVATNCYIFCESGKALVIDPADRADLIISAAADKDCTIEKIILTHGHFDHFGALDKLREKIGGLTVYAHREGIRVLGDPDISLCEEIGGRTVIEKPDVVVDDGDTIPFCDDKFEVIYTPGHTIDGICLKLGNKIFCGDTVFRGSVGRSDFPTGDMRTETASIKTKLLRFDDDTELYPGHGESSTIGYERKNNPYLIY